MKLVNTSNVQNCQLTILKITLFADKNKIETKYHLKQSIKLNLKEIRPIYSSTDKGF